MSKAKTNSTKPSIVLSSSAGLDASLTAPSSLIAANPLTPQSAPQIVQVPPLQLPGQYTPDGWTCPPNAKAQRANKRISTLKNRLIIGISSIQSEVIADLCRQAEQAYILRQFERVDAISTQLEQLNAPIASYFRGLAAQRSGKGDLGYAQRCLERAISSAPRPYRSRALLALGSVAKYRADYKAEAEFYRSALALNESDVFTSVETYRAIAIRASLEGDHAKAAGILERLIPFTSRRPYLQAQLLNSLAVEYHAIGRLEEAARLSRIVCASPLANVYAEFPETRREIQADIAQAESRAIIVAVKLEKKKIRRLVKLLILALIVFFSIKRVRPRADRAPSLSIQIIERVVLSARTRDGPACMASLT
jgi:tetratricopeptide (TPR) repeat protein